MSLPVVSTPEADGQIRTIDDWWRENRRASPDLFLKELSSAFEILARAPQIGRRYQVSPVPGTRRLLLRATRYHVYYVHANTRSRSWLSGMRSAASVRR